MKNFGIRGPEIVDGVGANAKMNEFCAAMGLCNLRHIGEEIEKRRKVYTRYMERLGNVDGLRFNPTQADVQSNYAYFPVIIEEAGFGDNREAVFERLARHDILARKYFYPLTNSFECFHDKYDTSLTPIAEKVSRSVLTLPMYADLPLEQVDRICEVFLDGRHR